jgi:hypothetical protein
MAPPAGEGQQCLWKLEGVVPLGVLRDLLITLLHYPKLFLIQPAQNRLPRHFQISLLIATTTIFCHLVDFLIKEATFLSVPLILL